MVVKQRNNFILVYDPSDDTARLSLFGTLVARWEGKVCYVEHAGGWLEVEQRCRKWLRESLHSLRSSLGYDTTFQGLLLRIITINDLKRWDKLMKHGIWKCKDQTCQYYIRDSFSVSEYAMNKQFRTFLIDNGYAKRGDSKSQLRRAGHRLCDDLGVVRRLNDNKLGLRKRLTKPSHSPTGVFDPPRQRYQQKGIADG